MAEADRRADMTVLLRSHVVKTAVDCRKSVIAINVSSQRNKSSSGIR